MYNKFRFTLVLALLVMGAPMAQAQDVTDDGRVGVVFAHPTPFHGFSGSPYVWLDQQTGSVTSYRFAFPNIIYSVKPWLQGWGGVLVTWKNNETSGNTREFRPYAGVKVFVPNSTHIHVYDWTRYEWRRTTNTDSRTISRVWRFRTRPGVEFPLSARAWQPGTFYGLANSEFFVEHDFVDAVRFMSGAGYIKNDRIRVEFSYVLELSRKSSSDALAYTDNSFRLDFKYSFKEALNHEQEGRNNSAHNRSARAAAGRRRLGVSLLSSDVSEQGADWEGDAADRAHAPRTRFRVLRITARLLKGDRFCVYGAHRGATASRTRQRTACRWHPSRDRWR
jgi:hypothetical protein